MTMNDASEIKQNADCRDVAESLLGNPARRSRKYLQWFCSFHEDGNTPSLTVYSNGYHCFGCGASGDVFDLIMRVEGLSFPEAVERLSRGDLHLAAHYTERNTRRSESETPQWQEYTIRSMQEAVSRLATAAGQQGMRYLQERGFTMRTCQVWQLGFEQTSLGPAITIPGREGETIKSLKYRLISHPDRRFTQISGSKFGLFGLNQLRGRRVLVVVEGEFNAMSIWQAASDLVDVVSYGSESNLQRAIPLVEYLAGDYELVIFWADKGERALEAFKATDQNAVAFRSPNGKDANDLLKAGQLRGLMVRLLSRTGLHMLDPEETPGIEDNASTHHEAAHSVDHECSALEAELERLLAALGRSPGIGMEWKDPRHPDHTTWLRFCEVEDKWIAKTMVGQGC